MTKLVPLPVDNPPARGEVQAVNSLHLKTNFVTQLTEYFERNTIPKHPQDLKDHSCIGFHFGNGLYRWEFEKGRKALTVTPHGPVSFDDPEPVIQAVLDGVGTGTAIEGALTEPIADA